MHKVLRNRVFLLGDVAAWAVIPFIALAIRLDGFAGIPPYADQLLVFAGLAIVTKFVAMWALGLYRRFWLFASVDELLLISVAVLLGAVAGSVAYVVTEMMVLNPVARLPRSVPLIDALLTLFVVGGVRLAPRTSVTIRERLLGGSTGRRVLIVGAGGAGTATAKELRSNRNLGLHPVGFIDDDPLKIRRTLFGLPVLGNHEGIPRIAKQLRVKDVIIAMPRAPGRAIREIKEICVAAGLDTKTIPGMHDLISGRVRVSQLRDVQIEDLLRREPVKTDQAAVAELVAGETVLVTGAGGSIGSEICRQIARLRAKRIVLLGHGENPIFDIHHELNASGYPDLSLAPVIADIRDRDRIHRILQEHQPRVVFHAAAHKHVPMMEANPLEAVTNNVGGTMNVVSASESADVERFVLISTDKAVKPANIMGLTKLLAEMLVHDVSVRTGRPYVSVRFGNVLASRGSVVPLFQKQIAAGGPVTVTHPDMMRYFMTIPEAVQLVLQAATLGTGGETFVLDMGEPVKIVDLANDLIKLSGYEVGTDIHIEYTGLRAGEKLFEELFSGDEVHRRTVHEKIFVGRNGHGLNFESSAQAQNLVDAAREGRTDDTQRLLRDMLPAFPIGIEQTASIPLDSAVRGNGASAPSASRRKVAQRSAVS